MMKNSIEEIDQLIKDTLSQEEAAFYDSLDEQNLLQMVFGLFRGKNAWLLIITNIVTVIFFACFVYTLVQYLTAEGQEELTRWGIGSLMLLLSLSMLKMYAWMQMDKNALLREIKRLELLIMSISK